MGSGRIAFRERGKFLMEYTEFIADRAWVEGIANAIRSKKGTTNSLLGNDFASEIESISGENRLNKLANNTLTHVTFADLEGATSIKYALFCNNSALETIEIPSTIKQFHRSAFDGCNSLKGVYYDGDVGQWCDIDIGDKYAAPISDFYFRNEQGEFELVDDLVIPDTATKIKPHAFYQCKSLTSVTIPDSVTSIGDSAFGSCPKLRSAIIGRGITSIARNVFWYGCPIKNITILADEPPSVETNSFVSGSRYTFYVKNVAKYEATTNWAYYKEQGNTFVEIDTSSEGLEYT